MLKHFANKWKVMIKNILQKAQYVLKNPQIIYIFYKTSVFSVIRDKCGNKNDKIFKEEESIEILKFPWSTCNKYGRIILFG